MLQAHYIVPIISAVLGLVGAIFGVLLAHRFTSERDRSQKRREILLKNLLEIWKDLEIGSRDELDICDKKSNLENGISMLQIFGSLKQIEKTNIFVNEMASANFADTTPIMVELRNEIRSQLGLEQIDGPINWLRIKLIGNSKSRPVSAS
ncbi:hypothetical protein [Methylobacterium haplocladii]|uniref:Uncharacterized protein n=1 Tax=Methylobacterium haplocladii TaxID=1176176 RepID=A0A512IJ41_9HYPH|nr:hypothetical protein [Methylobacterium haplocladii]GEO97721.1 hypothetical protein MHA02_01090 [Methylobacterium haplocladii]GLS57451.1 hypothetical protein GCM10007887_01060 [Methylobacterium haplocladii]